MIERLLPAQRRFAGERAGNGHRRMWRLLGASALSWASGRAAWTWYETVLGREVPFPSLADVGYLAAPPLAAAAERILDELRQPFVIGGRELHVRGSMGIAITPRCTPSSSNGSSSRRISEGPWRPRSCSCTSSRPSAWLRVRSWGPRRWLAGSIRPAGWSRLAGAGDDRERAARRQRDRPGHPAAPQGPGGAAGHRRLRHRLLLPQLPASLPGRHPQDRPVVRPSSWPCAAWAATSARATTSAARWRPATWTA